MEKTLSKININECYEKLSPLGAILDAPMCCHTTFKIGGPADILFVPHNQDELLLALRSAEKSGIPVYIMGNGSNLLVSDSGIRGLVIKLLEREPQIRFDEENNLMYVSASTLFSVAAKQSVNMGFMGLEWAVGIPGTVGGAIAMNAGAYIGEIKDCIKSVEAIVKGKNGYEIKHFDAQKSDFGYRYSKYAYPGCIVLDAVFSLLPTDGKAHERMEDFTTRRTTKQPLSFPSAGSVFKRPEGHFAGALIEQAGLKGVSVGGAQVSELHAGFIINTGNATANDVLELIALIKKRVFENSGVMLEEELKVIGG